MDDFSEKLNALLGSEDGLKKIKEIAGALGGGSLSGLIKSDKPESGKQKSSGGTDNPASSALDPEMLSKITAALGNISSNDDQRVLLLNALKPYMGKKRAPHIDTAIKLLALSKFKDLL